MRKLDLIDRKIILELDTNARATFSLIGKKLRIGKNNVQYRVKKLVEDGVIKKFVTQFSLGTLGLFLGKFYLQLSGFEKDKEKEMYQYLIKDNRISWTAKCEGRWDLLIGCYVESMGQLREIKQDFFKKFEKYITAYDVVFLVEGYTSQRTYLLNKKTATRKIEKFVGKGKVELDDKDKQIVRLISNNARFNFLDIAQKTGLNIKTIQRRINDLKNNGIIQGYVTFLDPHKIGYTFFKLCIYLQNYEKKFQSFLTYCMELPNVIHVIESLGPWEIELEIETESLEDFYNLTHQIRNEYSEIIKKTESVIISKELKLDFFPEWF
jgi:DNA-binding Lrp family transcriptional regulator|tara:strand:+ start:846 stop:1814 length:969 start_codon:yes stop_codon:yes gene_type:complete